MTTTVDGKRGPRETLDERLRTLRRYTSSSRYALTEDDVRWDWNEHGGRRYRPFDKQGDTEPFDVSRDWEERA